MSKDIFGLAFQDFLAGNTQGKILVDSNVSEQEELPVAYFFRDYKEMPPWEQLVMDESRGRVLDAGAGAGSHALYLQQKGLDVTAIDISPGSIACMKERGVEKAVMQDFMKLEDEKFDTLLFLMNGTGIAGRIEKLPTMLKQCACLLSENGTVYMESTDLLYLFKEEDGSAAINLAGDYYGEIIYQLYYKDVKGDPFRWLFVDYENLAFMAREQGLHAEPVYRGENDNYVVKLTHIRSSGL